MIFYLAILQSVTDVRCVTCCKLDLDCECIVYCLILQISVEKHREMH